MIAFAQFAEIAGNRKDVPDPPAIASRSTSLASAVENHAWDGAWYLRAYCDDGTPLGSARNSECQIDSIAQSWSVISGAADPQRAARPWTLSRSGWSIATIRLILLLTPPFDDGAVDPGYIKGYLPGIRENGAQYTHAATWVVQANALLGQGRSLSSFFRCSTRSSIAGIETRSSYKVEPYVVAGDVFSQPPLAGRGAGRGTRVPPPGSTGGPRVILGLRRSGETLTLDPCIPPEWKGFR